MVAGLTNSPNLAAAVARVQEAQGTAQIDGAAQWPSASAALTQDQIRYAKASNTHQILAQASYEMDFWGKNRAAAQSGDALARASAYDADTVAMTLSANIADGYFLVLSLRERIKLAQQISANARHVLDLTQVQRQTGTATDLQLQQQMAAVAGFDSAVSVLQQQQDVAVHALATLTGDIPEGFTTSGEGLTALTRPDIAVDMPAALLERRPDIQAAEARLRSANFDIGVARAAFFPSLSLNGGIGIASKTITGAVMPVTATDLGLSLVQPLFQGGALSGQLFLNKAKRTEMAQTYRQTILTALQDVEDSLSTLQHIQTQERINEVGQDAAQKAASLAELQYKLGSSDYLSVLTTEETQYQAEDTLLQARLLHLQALVSLFRALGGGFDDPSGQHFLKNTQEAQAGAPSQTSGVGK